MHKQWTTIYRMRFSLNNIQICVHYQLKKLTSVLYISRTQKCVERKAEDVRTREDTNTRRDKSGFIPWISVDFRSMCVCVCVFVLGVMCVCSTC